eukprot:UC1_evm1s829
MRQLGDTLRLNVHLAEHNLQVLSTSSSSLRTGKKGGKFPLSTIIDLPRIETLLTYIDHQLVLNVSETLHDAGVGHHSMHGRLHSGDLTPMRKQPAGAGATTAPSPIAEVPSSPTSSPSTEFISAEAAAQSAKRAAERVANVIGSNQQQRQKNQKSAKKEKNQQGAAKMTEQQEENSLRAHFDSTLAVDVKLGEFNLSLTTDTLNQLLFGLTTLQGELTSLSQMFDNIMRESSGDPDSG